jgi:hypothetical protein
VKDVGLIRFDRLFPQQATAEVRVITLLRHPTLPDDEYALVESYCDDPACHCRRVLLSVVGRRAMTALASIGYGFDRDGEWAGPFLDPLNPQSRHADALLELVRQLALTDPAYVARLEAHYYQVKGAAADPARRAPQTPPSMSARDRSRPLRPRSKPRQRRGR